MPKHLRIRSMMVNGKKDQHYLDLALEQRMDNGNIANGMSWTNPTLPRKGNGFDFSGVEKRLEYSIERGLNAFIMASAAKKGRWGFPKEYSDDWKRKTAPRHRLPSRVRLRLERPGA